MHLIIMEPHLGPAQRAPGPARFFHSLAAEHAEHAMHRAVQAGVVVFRCLLLTHYIWATEGIWLV